MYSNINIYTLSIVSKGSLEIDWRIALNNAIHTLWQLEYMASAPLPMPWMTQKLAEVLIRALHLIGKTSIFPETSHFYGVAPDESTETERQQRESFTKPKWKNYDFTMFWSCITTSHGIAVKWYLRVYWLLPLSIVDSFAENRRFFCWESTILLESTDDSFA